MSIKAIVYTSNTGHTERYAKMFGEKTGYPVYSVKEADNALAKNDAIFYFGWLFASSVKGYARVKKKYNVRAVCGVGLCTTGALLDEVRKNAQVPAETALFTVQGGMDRCALRGIHKFMIDMLTKTMENKKDKTDEEQEMLTLLKRGGDYVCEENLAEPLAWVKNL